VFAPIDRMVRVSLRTVVLDVPPQDVIPRQRLGQVNAVVYFRVMEPRRAIGGGRELQLRTSQLSQTTLRSVLGQVELDDLLSSRGASITNCRRSSTSGRTLGSRCRPSR